jgi:hypothetical protein
MASQMLDRLAEKFWAGESSELEERQLIELLDKHQEDGHGELRAYLRFLSDEKQVVVTEDKVTFKKDVSNIRGARNIRNWLSMAASFILIVSASFWIYKTAYTPIQMSPTTEILDTFDNAELAYAQVKKAMLLLSSNMNKGVEQAVHLEEFHKAANSIAVKN